MASQGSAKTQARSLRVCILNEFFYPDDAGGTGTVLTELVATLRHEYPEIHIDVVTSRHTYRSGTDTLDAFEEWYGVRIFRVASPRSQGKKPSARLWANTQFGAAVLHHLLRRKPSQRYDVVLVSSAPPALVGIAHIYKAITRTPFVYVLYDLEPDRAVVMRLLPPKGATTQALRRAQKRWLHGAARVVVLGRCMREYIESAYQVSSEAIRVIPIGCDPASIPVQPRDASAFRKKQGLEGFVVCYSGNFGRYHDFNTLLDAAQALRKSDLKVQFVLVGGGAQRQHVEERVRSEKIDNVHLFPFLARSEYPDLLASADVSLVTLEPGMEGLCVPSKFYSILASARPVLGVMSPACEAARVMNEAQCGVRVDVQDVDGLIDAIRQLAGDRDAAIAMGARGRAALEAHFTNRQIAQQYHDVLQEVAEERRNHVRGRVPSEALSESGERDPHSMNAHSSRRL